MTQNTKRQKVLVQNLGSLTYRPIFEIAIFGHEIRPLAKLLEVAHILFFKIAIFETWPLGKVPEVAQILSFYPKGSKLRLFP